MTIISQNIEEALSRLGKKLLYDSLDNISVIVCGGSALNILNIVSRTTKDVDVLAVVEEGEKGITVSAGKPLPENFKEKVFEVARDMNLPRDWFNMGPKNIIENFGLPDGLEKRLVRKNYGSLTVFFIDRLDQIHFKMLAAADPNAAPKHFEDLHFMEPKKEEVRMAVHWLLNRPTSSEFRRNVTRVVEALGYDDINREIQK